MDNSRIGAESEYYGHIRHELLRLAKPNAQRVLEIGCGLGNNLAWAKQNLGSKFCVGVELVPKIAEEAKRSGKVDEIYLGDIESLELPFAPHSFDLVIASHVLEHLKDPWAALGHIKSLLTPTGQLLGSLPNVRNLKVSVPLLFAGTWTYEDEGILDWTHTKFFTKQTIRDLLTESGFSVNVLSPEFGGKSRLANTLTFGTFQNLLCFTYNFSASPSGPSEHPAQN